MNFLFHHSENFVNEIFISNEKLYIFVVNKLKLHDLRTKGKVPTLSPSSMSHFQIVCITGREIWKVMAIISHHATFFPCKYGSYCKWSLPLTL